MDNLNITKDYLDKLHNCSSSVEQFKILIACLSYVNNRTIAYRQKLKDKDGDSMTLSEAYRNAFMYDDIEELEITLTMDKLAEILGKENLRVYNLKRTLLTLMENSIMAIETNDYIDIVPMFGRIRFNKEDFAIKCTPNYELISLFKEIEDIQDNISDERYMQVSCNDYAKLSSIREVKLYEFMCSTINNKRKKADFKKNTKDILIELGAEVKATESCTEQRMVSIRYADYIKKPLEKINKKELSVFGDIIKYKGKKQCRVVVEKK